MSPLHSDSDGAGPPDPHPRERPRRGDGSEPASAAPADTSPYAEGAAWRDSFSLLLARLFAAVFAGVLLLLTVTVRGGEARAALMAVSAVGAVACGIPALTGWPSGRLRGWLLVGSNLAGALLGYATLGFIAGPAVVLSLMLLLSGLLLGRRTMLWLFAASFAFLGILAAAVVHGAWPTPRPVDVSMREPLAWARTLAITFIATSLVSTIVIGLVARLERSLLHAREEAARRERAEAARRQTEIRALEARQLETVGRLAAGVAHDFNNQLSAILACTHLLKERTQQTDDAEALLTDIHDAARRAADLTAELLAYSRKAQMVLAPTDLHRVVEASARLGRHAIGPGVTIVTRLDARQQVVALDVTLMQSALLNLLLNAGDAIPERGEVTITTADHVVDDGDGAALPRGRYVALEVQDTGAGISSDALDHIFEPFFTTKPVGKGTGLGLAAVAGTVKSHGGSISVSPRVGGGTTFRVLLPVSDLASAPPRYDASAPVRGAGHLLVVDDEPIVAKAAVAMLRSLGYELSEARDGATAVAMVEARPDTFALVLLDLRMPGLTGEETFDRLRAIAPRLPIVIWSGYPADQDVEGMLQRGAAAFVQKPYRVADLSRTIADAIRAAAAERRSSAGDVVPGP